MDSDTKKACYDEITHLIFDSNQKININQISNNWHQTLCDSEKILLDWFEKNKEKKLIKEYLIRGIDRKNGHSIITIVSEHNLIKVEKKCSKFSSILFSVEVPTKNNRLNHVPLSTPTVINLPLHGDSRVNEAQVGADSAEAVKTINNDKQKKLTNVNLPKEQQTKIKTELVKTPSPPSKSSNNDKPSTTSKSPSIVGDKKDIKISPSKKQTPPTSGTQQQSPKKKDSTKTGKIVATGKSAISSFFSSKSTATTASSSISSSSVTSTNKNIIKDTKKNVSNSKNDEKQQSMKKEDTSTSSSGHKRSHSNICDTDDDDEAIIPGTPQETTKKVRKLTSKASTLKKQQHSRIRQIVDSSSDDDDTTVNKKKEEDEPMEQTSVERDEEEARSMLKEKEKENKTPSPTITQKNAFGGRNKAKRTVTKTYIDDEGYVVSVKETEEYSLSEDDDDSVKLTTPTTTTAATSATGATASTSSPSLDKKSGKQLEVTTNKNDKNVNKKTTKSKTNSSALNNKQGSILNFFQKK